jgi:protein involved in sex pheromone biosynthesis
MKKLFVLLATAATLMLAACGKLSFDSDTTSTAKSGTTTGAYQTTGTVDNSMYQGVIKNGRYQTSSARGLQLTQNTQGSNMFNVESMENGLLTLAKQQFSTSKYVFQEGQLLSTATAENWLGRQSKSNPTGLNPADNGKNGETTRAPIYLQTLLEQDFMVQAGNKLNLGGVAVALGLNEYDYYTKEQYGATYTTHIGDATLTKQGKAMAQTVVARLRKLKGVGNDTPIIIGLYKNAGADSLVGGTFIDYVISKSGTSLGSWSNVNEKNQVLPTVENAKPINQTVADDFDNFKDKVQNFFPTLAGVTAQTHYTNNKLTGMNVTINTQFYGESEIQSFTQLVATSATKYLPAGVKLEITIQSTGGVQAFIARESGSKGLYTHVFSSY